MVFVMNRKLCFVFGLVFSLFFAVYGVVEDVHDGSLGHRGNGVVHHRTLHAFVKALDGVA